MSDFCAINAKLNETPIPTKGIFVSDDFVHLGFTYRNEMIGKAESCMCISSIKQPTPFMVHTDSEVLVTYSNNGNKRAVLRSVAFSPSMPIDTPKIGDPGSVKYLELFENNRLLFSHVLDKDTGNFQTFPTITSGLVISPDEKYIAWVASPDTKHERKSGENMPKVRMYNFKDYGEDISKVYETVLVIYDVEARKARVIGTPKGYGACQFTFASSNVMVLQAVNIKQPRLLGLRSYENRPFHLFAVNIAQETPEFKPITDNQKVYLNPRAVQIDDKTARVFFTRFIDDFGGHGGPCHFGYLKLDLETLEVIETRESETSESIFTVPMRCFIDKETVAVSIEKRCKLLPVKVNLNTFEMTEILSDSLASFIIDDVRGDKILLRIGKMTETPRFAVLEGSQLSYLTESVKYDDYSLEIDLADNMNDAILVIAPGEKKKFVVSPHGGPSGMFSTYWSRLYAFFYLNGYSICLVNFRGSTGYPAEVQKSLPGHCGELDVGDCVEHITKLRQRFNVEKLGVWGWSHGGYLACALAGLHSDKIDFSVAGAPVVNMISSYYMSDIPDWPLVESGVKIPADGEVEVDEEVLKKMWKASVIRFAKDVAVPMLMIHGHNDRRVTVEQTIDYYLALKRNGKTVKMLLYEGIGHSWSPTDICFDMEVSSVSFFNDPEGFVNQDDE